MEEEMGRGGRPFRLAGSTLVERAHICVFFNGSENNYRVLLSFINDGLTSARRVRTPLLPATC